MIGRDRTGTDRTGTDATRRDATRTDVPVADLPPGSGAIAHAVGRHKAVAGRRTWPRRLAGRLPVGPMRLAALLGTLALLASFLQVLYFIVDVAGDLTAFWVLVAGSLLAATVLARVLRVVVAFTIAMTVLVVGLAWYILSLPFEPDFVAMLFSNVELLSGKSLLQIERSPIWALSVTPAPVFLIWYFALRRWYATAVIVGSLSLAYLVLTSDAGLTVTLIGVVGAAAALGFGDLDRREGDGPAAEYVAFVLAVMVVVPLLVSVVPGGTGAPLALTGDEAAQQTVEASIIGTDDRMEVQGSIDLSPKVRFTVTSSEPRYWRVGSFDRFTGRTWLRVGTREAYADSSLALPRSRSRFIFQQFEAETAVDVMPAAWRPIQLGSGPGVSVSVTDTDSFVPETTLEPGTTYRVQSAVVEDDPDVLREAGTDYPPSLEDRFTQLPGRMPDRVADRTDSILGTADSPYQAAVRIERWLERNRQYSLDVEKPDGNVADAFLFDMNRGYCVYYATTMATMLRTQGIPARMVVGYTSGEKIDREEWLVRGYNSHAWVEVYFPDVGWVAFDPTPSGPRGQAEQSRLEEARIQRTIDVDTNESRPDTLPAGGNLTSGGLTPTPPSGQAVTNATDDETADPTSTPGASRPGGGEGGVELPDLPSGKEAALGAVVVIGVVAGLRRLGIGTGIRHRLWLRFGREDDPNAEVERVYERLAGKLATQQRPRRKGETVRQYLDAIDAGPRVRRVARARERARYGDGVSDETAGDIRDLAERIIEQQRSGNGR